MVTMEMVLDLPMCFSVSMVVQGGVLYMGTRFNRTPMCNPRYMCLCESQNLAFSVILSKLTLSVDKESWPVAMEMVSDIPAGFYCLIW